MTPHTTDKRPHTYPPLNSLPQLQASEDDSLHQAVATAGCSGADDKVCAIAEGPSEGQVCRRSSPSRP